MTDINDNPLRRQIDRRIAETVAENVELRRQLDAANARVGAALREAATEGAGLVDGNVEAASVYGAILALAPDATAALDRALEQMRERCAQEAQYIATVGDGQSIAAAIRALPLHEEPNNEP